MMGVITIWSNSLDNAPTRGGLVVLEEVAESSSFVVTVIPFSDETARDGDAGGVKLQMRNTPPTFLRTKAAEATVATDMMATTA